MLPFRRLILSSAFSVVAVIQQVFAAPVAHENFNYGGSVNLTTETSNGGSGWTEAWATIGVSGLVTSGTGRSLAFGQAPPNGLTFDGSSHAFSDGIKGNKRDWSQAVNLTSQTMYFTALVRVFGGPNVVDLRAEFFDGAGATGNMRGNVGISNGDLFVHTRTSGYLPTGASVETGLVADETTYLLAMKRTGVGISAALIPANGDLGTLNSEPTWQVTHAGSSGVDLRSMRLNIDGTGGGIRIDELRIATDWRGSVDGLAVPEPDKTFVFKMDQPATSEAKSWTHTVAEAGNYQIGLAWAQALSDGDVAVEVFHNSMRVKAFYATPGEVKRFETRLENLAVGDEITVKTATDGASYRMAFQIAFGTPTFAGLPTFYVADHGAVGDGITDDMAAIKAAVTAAQQAGGGIVSLDGTRTYRAIGLSDFTVEYLLDLQNARNIKIEGNGAKVLLHPPDSLLRIENSENIQVDGLTSDFLPKPYYQGTINAINVAEMTIDITVPDRYPIPQIGTSPKSGSRPFFGRAFVPEAPGARSGKNLDNIYVDSVSQIGNERELRIQVPASANGVSMSSRVQAALDRNATEFVVPHLLYGHLGGVNRVHSNSRVKISNLHQVCAPYIWFSILHNTGPITLANVDLKMSAPETELCASWRDGMHIKNGRWGILIEDGDWDGASMYDDLFALYSRTQKLVGVSGNVATLTPSFEGREIFLWQPGDWASIWSPDQAVFRGMARVMSARLVDLPNYEVTFEALPGGILANDIVIHEESLNRGTVIRRCSTSNVGTKHATTRFRGTDVLFQDNHFEDFQMRFEYDTSLATPRARDVVIEDSYLTDDGGQVILTRPLGVTFRGGSLDATELFGSFGTKDLVVDGVNFTNRSGPVIRLINQSNAFLFGKSVRNGSTTVVPATWLSTDDSSTVTQSAPSNYLPTVPPSNGEDTVAPAAPTGLTFEAASARVVLDWDRNVEPDSFTYKIYRGTMAGGPYTEVATDLQVSRWVDGSVTDGTTYHYVVTALDNSGNESAFSAEVEILPAVPVEIASEDFDYPDATALEGGLARGGRGWIGGWSAIGNGGLRVVGGTLGQTGGATREIQTPFSLDGPNTYFSFIARTNPAGAFSFSFKQSFGDFVRWAFARNADGSITVNGANHIVSSAPSLFLPDTDYLVVSKYQTAGDTGFFKLFPVGTPGDFTTEPSIWDLQAAGLSGVTIDRLDIQITGGSVTLDDVRIGRTYQSVTESPEEFSEYEDWAGRYHLVGGPSDDDDGDGVANVIEYALGGNPADSADRGHALITGFSKDGGSDWFTLTYPRRSDAASGLVYSAIISETLTTNSWTSTGVEQVGVEPSGFGPGFDAVSVRVSTMGRARLFIRLKVELH
jgi:hypothetical protein